MRTPYHQEIVFPPHKPVSLRRVERDLDREWHVNNHFHDLCEMVVYESIEGVIFHEGEAQAIRSGQLLFVPQETIHSFIVKPGRPIYHVLHFQPACIARLNPDFRLPTRALVLDVENEDFRCLLALIRWYIDTEENIDCPTAQGDAFHLILSIFFEKILKPEHSKSLTSSSTFSPLVKHLNRHNKYKLSVDDAAVLCHLSRSHFMTKFKQTYGVTFNRFMLERKIETAKYMLRSTNKSVTEIAHTLEMENASYFTKLFKSSVGCTPKIYARKSLNNPAFD